MNSNIKKIIISYYKFQTYDAATICKYNLVYMSNYLQSSSLYWICFYNRIKIAETLLKKGTTVLDFCTICFYGSDKV